MAIMNAGVYKARDRVFGAHLGVEPTDDKK